MPLVVGPLTYLLYLFGFFDLTYTFRLRNDLYCVGWGVKLYSLTHSLDVYKFQQPYTMWCVCVCVYFMHCSIKVDARLRRLRWSAASPAADGAQQRPN